MADREKSTGDLTLRKEYNSRTNRKKPGAQRPEDLAFQIAE
jgi:hypothetical protein